MCKSNHVHHIAFRSRNKFGMTLDYELLSWFASFRFSFILNKSLNREKCRFCFTKLFYKNRQHLYNEASRAQFQYVYCTPVTSLRVLHRQALCTIYNFAPKRKVGRFARYNKKCGLIPRQNAIPSLRRL